MNKNLTYLAIAAALLFLTFSMPGETAKKAPKATDMFSAVYTCSISNVTGVKSDILQFHTSTLHSGAGSAGSVCEGVNAPWTTACHDDRDVITGILDNTSGSCSYDAISHSDGTYLVAMVCRGSREALVDTSADLCAYTAASP